MAPHGRRAAVVFLQQNQGVGEVPSYGDWACVGRPDDSSSLLPRGHSQGRRGGVELPDIWMEMSSGREPEAQGSPLELLPGIGGVAMSVRGEASWNLAMIPRAPGAPVRPSARGRRHCENFDGPQLSTNSRI